MRLCMDVIFQPVAKCVDLFFRQGSRLRVETYEGDHSRNLEYEKPLLRLNPHEHVTREQRQLNQLATIFPTMPGAIKWQEGFNAPVLQLPSDDLLVAGVGIHREPLSRLLFHIIYFR